MMIHPGPDNQLDTSFQANQRYSVEFFWKESHAAAAPEQGLNALDAFEQAYVNVATCARRLSPETWPTASSTTEATRRTSSRPTRSQRGASGPAITSDSRY